MYVCMYVVYVCGLRMLCTYVVYVCGVFVSNPSLGLS